MSWISADVALAIVGQAGGSREERSVTLWQVFPFGEHRLHFSAGCDGRANDRDNMSVSNLVRPEVIMLWPWLHQVNGALSMQFPSLMHFHRLEYPTVPLCSRGS